MYLLKDKIYNGFENTLKYSVPIGMANIFVFRSLLIMPITLIFMGIIGIVIKKNWYYENNIEIYIHIKLN